MKKKDYELPGEIDMRRLEEKAVDIGSTLELPDSFSIEHGCAINAAEVALSQPEKELADVLWTLATCDEMRDNGMTVAVFPNGMLASTEPARGTTQAIVVTEPAAVQHTPIVDVACAREVQS